MIINAEIDEIQITFTKGELKPRHMSQLHYWGFKISDEGYIKFSQDNVGEVLSKVINFLENNRIPFSITNSTSDFLQQIKNNKIGFRRHVERAKDFKEGKYDKKEFSREVNFLNKNIFRQLKDHQVKAYYHLSILGNGANFSVPGSGKTSVVLAHYEKMRLMGEVNVLFVVGPAACFAPWRYEFEAVFNRKPKYTILAGGDINQRQSEYYKPDGFSELYLTTFQTLLNDQEYVKLFFRNRLVNAYFVVDEAHYLKRIDGQWANAVIDTSRYAKNRCALTGTPIPRSYSDVFNLFDFLWPNQKPITPDDRALLLSLEEQNRHSDAQKLLKREIGPMFYRVRKTELSLKPQIFHEPTMVEMNPIEREIYDAIITQICNYSQKDYLQNIDVVKRLRRGRMIRLRQCVSYSKLLLTAVDNYDKDESLIASNINLSRLIAEYAELERPAKLEKLLEIVNGFREMNQKVVIWTHFIGTVNLIENALIESGLICKIIIGSVPVEKSSVGDEETREKIIAEFIDSNSGLDILIANPAACAESISLHKTCHNAIYYDLSFNGAQYLQSLDRIHRVGGSEDVESHYHYLQYTNTIDPNILENLNQKAQRMYNIIDGDYNIYSLDMFENDEDGDLEAYEILFGEK